jgi:hypothetical protein
MNKKKEKQVGVLFGDIGEECLTLFEKEKKRKVIFN